jgi:precorrin-2 methylase
MAGEAVSPLKDKPEGPAPYVSLILLPGQGRRP